MMETLDTQNLLIGEPGGNIKIEAESDLVFFGLNNNTIMAACNNPVLSSNNAADDILDMKNNLTNADTFMASDISDLDFDLLHDDFNLLDDILMNDESTSNSFSSESYVFDSVSDSPPLTPPSPTSSSNSSMSQFSPGEIKLEPLPAVNGIIQVDLSSLNNHLKTKLPCIPKSSRGRSASQEAPEVQALKRHIRMIRNRESACMSRKKKKDYVTGVENRVKELEAENFQLKQENSLLKAQLLKLGHSIAAPTNILLSATSAKIPHSKPASNTKTKGNKSNTTNLSTTAAKIVLLSLCCFLFVSFRSQNPNEIVPVSNSSHTMSKMMLNSDNVMAKEFLSPASSSSLGINFEHNHDIPAASTRGKRSIGLWEKVRIDDNFVDQNQNNHSNRTRSSNNTLRHLKLNTPRIRDINETLGNENIEYHNETLTNIENCGLLFNQTEALRVQNSLKGIFGKPPKRVRRKPLQKPIVYSLIDLNMKLNENNKGLTVYDEKIRKYAKVFDQLERREDTYYVVSLSMENQILFPAKAHNISTRPKMSFLMPWKNETHGGKEELMQIDCEVTGVFALNKPIPNK